MLSALQPNVLVGRTLHGCWDNSTGLSGQPCTVIGTTPGVMFFNSSFRKLKESFAKWQESRTFAVD